MNKILAILLCLMLPVWSYAAVDFDGSADYIDASAVGTFGSGIADGVTFSMWVKFTDTSNTYIYGVRDSVATNQSIAWETRHSGGYDTNERIWIQDADSNYLIAYVNGYDNLNDGYWHHVAFSFDGPNNTAKIYVDGDSKSVSYQLQQTPDNFSDFTASIYYGAYNNSGSPLFYWDGSLDDIRIYSRILDDEEVENLALSRTRLSITDGLVAWWRLDEYSEDYVVFGSDLIDYSGNNHTAEGKGSDSLVKTGSELVYP